MPIVRCPVMVGRDDELADLRRALESARHGAVVVVSGGPGMGKSRLVAELAGQAGRDDVLVVTGRATPARTAEAYAPLREALLQATRGRDWRRDVGEARWRTPLVDLLAPEERAAPPYPDGAGVVMRGAGPAQSAIRHSGLAATRGALTRAFAPSRREDGTYRQDNVFRFLVARR